MQGKVDEVMINIDHGHQCPFCKGFALERREELWFGTFKHTEKHTEKKCAACGYYRYM